MAIGFIVREIHPSKSNNSSFVAEEALIPSQLWLNHPAQDTAPL